MKCPVCKNQIMTNQQLEANLSVSVCSQCSGKWIASYQYWKWKEASGRTLPAQEDVQGDDLSVEDNTAAKLCPECGHLLRRYPVGHGIDFGVDRCGNCGGMWFDANEWEVLKSQKLHDDVHKIFSEIWQRQIRDEEHQAATEAFYREKFGSDGYEKAQEIKTWIDAHPHKSELRAFLGL